MGPVWGARRANETESPRLTTSEGAVLPCFPEDAFSEVVNLGEERCA